MAEPQGSLPCKANYFDFQAPGLLYSCMYSPGMLFSWSSKDFGHFLLTFP
jgi:hypothetical protein